MKLFVVGETSPDPDAWSIWSELKIVVAQDAEQAIALTEHASNKVCEIPMDKPQVLVSMSEPSWGEDL